MNREEERFRNKITKIVMIVLVIGFLASIVSTFYCLVVFSPADPVQATKTAQDSAQTHGRNVDTIFSMVKALAFIGTEILVILLTLLATKLPLLLRWISTPVVWLIVTLMRSFGWFKGSREAAAKKIEVAYGPLISPLLALAQFLYSEKTCKEAFLPIVGDFEHELYKAIYEGAAQKETWRKISCSYHILAAMVEKSPVGDLIEFIRKIAK